MNAFDVGWVSTSCLLCFLGSGDDSLRGEVLHCSSIYIMNNRTPFSNS